MIETFPRLMVAGLSGDSGKTLLSLGLAGAWRRRGLDVAGFKKGPDYIDAAWLGAATGGVVSNLDTFLMTDDVIRRLFAWRCKNKSAALIEGNRGLFDGLGAEGLHSSAALAKLLDVSVVLVVDATKVTRTLAALVLGCREMDPELRFAGVVLNRVGTARHARVAREAIESVTGIPVLGAIPRLEGDHRIPGRHLGLVPVDEYDGLDEALDYAAGIVENHLDLERLAENAGTIPEWMRQMEPPFASLDGAGLTFGVLRDGAFSFYYPENLEILTHSGARVLTVHSMRDERLPQIDALYIGGGFPETHAERLSGNAPLRRAIADAAKAGLPIYAECGGLMYLSRAIEWNDKRHPMCGVLPIDVRMEEKPRGHGYVEMRVGGANPFFDEGALLRGHEFHYSHVTQDINGLCSLSKGKGLGNGSDGIFVEQTLALYTHLHALSSDAWAKGMIRAAREYNARKHSKPVCRPENKKERT